MKQELVPSAFYKGMRTEIRSSFNHLVATEEWTAQIRSRAACVYVPLPFPQIPRDFAGGGILAQAGKGGEVLRVTRQV